MVIIDFLWSKRHKKNIPNHKITNVSKLTKYFRKKLFLFKSLIGYSLAISFECQQEDMQIPFKNMVQVTRIKKNSE